MVQRRDVVPERRCEDQKRALATLGEDKGAGLTRRHTLTLRARVVGGGDSIRVAHGTARVVWDEDEGALIIEAELVSDRDDPPPFVMDINE